MYQCLGAEGAGIATCIANIVALMYLLQVVLRNKETVTVLNPARLRLEAQIAKQVILVGIVMYVLLVQKMHCKG